MLGAQRRELTCFQFIDLVVQEFLNGSYCRKFYIYMVSHSKFMTKDRWVAVKNWLGMLPYWRMRGKREKELKRRNKRRRGERVDLPFKSYDRTMNENFYFYFEQEIKV